jgi:hypothetical protein
MNKPTLKPYIPKAFGTKSLEKATARPKLVNKYVFANAEKDANKIERNSRNEESPAPNKGYT